MLTVVNQSNVSTKKEIVLEVSKRLNLDIKKVDYVFDFIFNRYLKLLIEKKGVCTVIIPHLGQLHMKYGFFRNYYKSLIKNFDKYSKLTKIRLLRIKDKILMMEEGFKENNSTCKSHMKNYKIRNKYFTLGKNFEEIQKWQNGEEK